MIRAQGPTFRFEKSAALTSPRSGQAVRAFRCFQVFFFANCYVRIIRNRLSTVIRKLPRPRRRPETHCIPRAMDPNYLSPEAASFLPYESLVGVEVVIDSHYISELIAMAYDI
eukprot:8405522-Pyramimonas_sp.AAC.1